MKKLLLILTLVLILILMPLTAVPASAAEVSAFSSGESENTNSVESPEQNGGLPSYYSSLDSGLTTSVKTQSGDLCWAYSSIASYETLLLKNDIFYGDLSVGELDLWGTVREDGFGWQRNEMESGYTYIPVGFFTSWSGPLSSDDEKPRYGITALEYLNRLDRDSIKRAILDAGAVTTNLNFLKYALSSDQTSYCLSEYKKTISGHSVSVVGWDDNYPKENFNGSYTPENDGAWLCKNSWGNSNSIGGYLWISYEDFYLFNDEYLAYGFGIKDFQKINKNDFIYQNEIYGATYEFTYIDESKVTYFNIFDFSEGGDILDKVIFESTSAGASYTVYYVPINSEGVPVDDKNSWEILDSGTVDYKGYICADFENKTVIPAKAAIAVEIDVSGLDAKNGIGVSEWLRNRNTGKMLFEVPCEAGKSFVGFSEGIVDIKDYYLCKLDDDMGGCIVIKAVTSGRGDVDLNGEENINDASLIQQKLANFRVDLSEEQTAIADVNGDGIVNINDVTQIQIDLL